MTENVLNMTIKHIEIIILNVKSIHENLRCHCNLCSYNTTRTNYLCKQKYSNYVQKHQESAILKILKVFMKMYAIIVNYALTQQIVPAI